MINNAEHKSENLFPHYSGYTMDIKRGGVCSLKLLKRFRDASLMLTVAARKEIKFSVSNGMQP